MKFGSIAEFEKFYENVKLLKSEEVSEFFAKNADSSFKSFNMSLFNLSDDEKKRIVNGKYSPLFYLNFSEKDGFEAFPRVEDYALQQILNSDAIVLVGNDAIMFDRAEKTIIENFSYEKLNELRRGLKSEFPLENNQIETSKKARGIFNGKSYDSRHNYYNSGIRLKSYYDYSGSQGPGYWNRLVIGAKLQDRIAGFWWPEQAQYVKVSGVYPFSLLNSRSNHDCVEAELYYYPQAAAAFEKDGSFLFTSTAESKWNNEVRTQDVDR